MDTTLKRVLDYKMVFDCLSDGSNGMVSLHVLAARWPRGEELEGELGVGLVASWKAMHGELSKKAGLGMVGQD